MNRPSLFHRLLKTDAPILLKSGFFAMAHEAGTDWCMLLGSVFLLFVGGGALSLDAIWQRPRERGDS